MVYGYTRVSTEGQVLENQSYEIKEYCKTHSLKVDIWYEEKVSGTKLAKDRELGKLLKLAKEGDTIICTEISRIGRSVIDCLGTINYLSQKKVILIAIKQGFVLDESLNSLMISTIFSLMAQLERELLSRRVKEALAMRKAAGQKLGRPFGSKNIHNKLEEQKDYIEMCLKTGRSRYYIRKHIKTHAHTLNNFLVESGLAKKYDIKFTQNFLENGLRIKKRHTETLSLQS